MNLARLVGKQTAVYWGNPTPDGYGGYTFTAPVEIKVRWENLQEQFISYKGEELISRAKVYTESALHINGYLMLGTLNDLNSDQLPETQEGAYIIQGLEEIPDIKIQKYLRTAWL